MNNIRETIVFRLKQKKVNIMKQLNLQGKKENGQMNIIIVIKN